MRQSIFEDEKWKALVKDFALGKKLAKNEHELEIINNIELSFTRFFHKVDLYFPEQKLREGLTIIENNPYFFLKKPANDIETYFVAKVLWEQSILFHFVLYSFVKAGIETINEVFPSKDNYPNSIIENAQRIKEIENIVKNGGSQISSTKAVREIILGYLEGLLSVIKAEDKNLMIKALEIINDDLRTQSLIANDLKTETQQKIFDGIFDLIKVTKFYKGKQSKNLKCNLLWHLFRQTHPQLYNRSQYISGSEMERERNRNLSRILSIKSKSH